MSFEENTNQNAVEQEPQQLSKEVVLQNFHDTYQEPEPLPVELPEVVTTMYPRFIQKEVAERIQDIEQSFPEVVDAPEHKKSLYAQREAGRIKEERYTFDDNTRLPNTRFVKEQLAEVINQEMAREETASFDHIAHISIDLNGLKAVNDLNDGKHSVGDQYLRYVADWLWHSDVLQTLKSEGAKVTIGRTGGDEFAITIVCTRKKSPPIDSRQFGLAWGMGYNPESKSINENLTQEKKIDWKQKWSDTKVGLMLELDKLDVQDLIPKEKIQELIPDAPDNFTFKASAGFGLVTLEQALTEEQSNDKNIIHNTDNAERITEKLMGTMIDMSDDEMHRHKAFHKDWLKHGTDSDRALAKLLTRTEEQRILEEDYNKLKKDFERMQSLGLHS